MILKAEIGSIRNYIHEKHHFLQKHYHSFFACTISCEITPFIDDNDDDGGDYYDDYDDDDDNDDNDDDDDDDGDDEVATTRAPARW